MPAQLICCSHSPLMMADIEASEPEGQRAFFDTMDAVSKEVHAFSPDLVVCFGPDHFNGFFYDLMPAFCLGMAAHGTHDWGLPGGPLRVPADLALDCARALHRQDLDVAVSYDMCVDHGNALSLTQLTGALARYDVLPVFLNCAADPRPSMRRSRLLGEAVGRFLADRGLRVTFIGSGGLSHDPPTPRLRQTPSDIAQRLIKRHTPSAEELAAREARVIQAGRDLVAGKGPCMPPDQEWDHDFMSRLCAWDVEALDAMDDAQIDRKGGFGGHEIRTWVAAAAAARAIAAHPMQVRYYHVIPEWLTGMGIVTAG
ncbi:2,3-dihydroxyphenylpropionate/2, 3-dihydroxicinnamic acid 1,2-dioxygenase [Pigmentiphaga humi]|uniref:2,3-dihydroxyphenylpropionate/2, 3-dihydroxicinnamic acid 1,2-dioxygenase n=1 Tax=Pigmentiphaga humi TaxID=2478468 RepID=A0A3P4B3T2_9BURK|nr:3-carboxyethylcatechol 2,3-dioxygenase [Pigmentiphaga humi]VCU70581.1 2,3-dihydroxyphenylpropionate/2, 3-dihydroxicinnamic acid 1,2-dioxygenase [Pigmentiphaga humi]